MVLRLYKYQGLHQDMVVAWSFQGFNLGGRAGVCILKMALIVHKLNPALLGEGFACLPAYKAPLSGPCTWACQDSRRAASVVTEGR